MVIEDHPMMSDAVRSSIAAQVSDVGFHQVTSLSQALVLLQRAHDEGITYQLIVTDLNLPDSKGIDTIRRLKSCSQSSPIVVLSMDDDPKIIQECKKLITDYISKSDTSNRFERFVKAICKNFESPVQRNKERQNFEVQIKPSYPSKKLTPKQNLVLYELAQGYSNKEIARKLNISDQTVRDHLVEIFRRLGVKNRTQATKYFLLSTHDQ